MDTAFARVIEEHLELKRKNSQLDTNMPLERYRVDDPFENHPLFKSEEQARLEETLGGAGDPESDPHMVLAWPTEEIESESEPAAERPNPEDSLWGRSRDFDWGD